MAKEKTPEETTTDNEEKIKKGATGTTKVGKAPDKRNR